MSKERVCYASGTTSIVGEEKSMQISARNQLVGKVVTVVYGNVMAEIVVELDGGQHVVSLITSQSAKSLNLQAGTRVAAIVKSTDVLIGLPD